jgi:hypothetical protein
MYFFALLLKGHLQQEIPRQQESIQLLDAQLLQQYLLDGETETEGQCLTITLLPNRRQQAMLRITWYGQITMKTVLAHIMRRMSCTPLSLGRYHFTLETLEIDHPTWTGISTWTDLSRKKSGYHIRFRFVTPIVTKISSCPGKTVAGPFPEPPFVFSCLYQQWQHLQGPLHAQTAEQIVAASQCLVSAYHLRTIEVTGECSRHLGYSGWIEFTCHKATDQEALTSLHTLAQLAFFTGIGYYTKQGMGATLVTIAV